jgi:tRNA-splicing ligase RtcB
MKVISTENIPIKLWLDNIEEGALKQAKNLANLPFAFKHIAIMPDSHQGYGMPIGGVLATKGVIIPRAVGVDIGCGMCAVRTNFQSINKEGIKVLFGGSKDYHGGIRSKIPVGFSRHNKIQDSRLIPSFNMDNNSYNIIDIEYTSALKQLGTLGGGNHFIEIQKGSDGYIWIMVHSGSRNLGYKVANYYNDIAKKLNKNWYSSISKKVDLAFLNIDSMIGQAYLKEMNYCVEFAFANRKLMMDRIKETFKEQFPNIKFEPMINIAHNYATMENHFGSNVMVHRKGATSARKGQLGIIPGSQGTKSYIIRGLGNPESFNSCSHGAGRLMSRTRAKAELNLEEEIRKMDEQGIVHGIRNKKNLDEAIGAYKSIDKVMYNQRDLVEIVVELTPLGVIKG